MSEGDGQGDRQGDRSTDYGVDVLAFGPHPDDVIGVSHGEPLRSPSVPGLVDPVRQFRDNPFPEAHAFEPLS